MIRHVGDYVRELAAPLPRLIENALDWEHLPHQHATDFTSISLTSADQTGWSADVMLPGGTALTLDLRIDEDRLGWVTNSRSEDRVVSRIESRAEVVSVASCSVSVRFFADVPEADAAKAGAFYRLLYSRLYDEDEAMMVARQQAILRGPEALRETRTVVLADGETAQMPIYCPHQGLPIDAEPDAQGIVACPWHGYRFDVRTGACVSGQSCRFVTA